MDASMMRYVVLALGIACLVGGAVGFVIANANASAASVRFLSECFIPTFPLSPTCADLLNQLNYWGTIRNLSIVVVVVGIVVLVLGVALEAMKGEKPLVPVAPAPYYAPPPRLCASCGFAVPPGWTHCGRCGAKQ